MTGFDDGATLADRFRQHASRCSSPLYAALMVGMADDWEAGGIVREVCAGWEDAPRGTVLQLRLLGGLSRVVLRREAPELATYWATLGGSGAPDTAWPVARKVIAAHADELRAGLDLAPQTNEPGRAAALHAGLVDAVSRTGLRRVRLLEVGASGGLNLLVDRFRIGWVDPDSDSDGTWWHGPADSPLVLPDAVVGPVPDAGDPSYDVVERRGCDLAPVDASTTEGRLRLSSFVWPDHVHRWERLQSALAVAADHPVSVDESPAGEWLEDRLTDRVHDGVLTVVWNSITRLYWPESEVARVAAAVAAAPGPVAHVQMEYDEPGVSEPRLRLDVAVRHDGVPDGRPTDVGDVADHGVPVTLRRV